MLEAAIDGTAVADNDDIAGTEALIEDNTDVMGPGKTAEGGSHRCMLMGPDTNNHLEGFAKLSQGVLDHGLKVKGAPGDVFTDDVASHMKRQFDDLHPGAGHQIILHGDEPGERFDR